MKESISFSESQEIIGGTDERAKNRELDRLRELNCRSVCVRKNAEQRQETEELRDLCDNQARIIEGNHRVVERQARIIKDMQDEMLRRKLALESNV
jgi:hypothetical protein